MAAAMSWSGEKVLGIINPATDTFTCVGYAPSKNRRCQNAIAVANRHEVQKRIRALPKHFGNSVGLRHELSVIASKALCKHDHQEQTGDMAEQWSDVIARTLQRQKGGLNGALQQGEETVFLQQPDKKLINTRNPDIPSLMKSEPRERTWTTNKSQRNVKQKNEGTMATARFKREQEAAQKVRREARYQALKRTEDQAFKRLKEASSRADEARKRADDVNRRLCEVGERADDANMRLRVVCERLDEVNSRAEQEKAEKRDQVLHREAEEARREARSAKPETPEEDRREAEQRKAERREAGQQIEEHREAEQQEEPRELEEAAATDRTPTEPEGESICNDAWAISWTRYERAWSKLSRVNNTTLDEPIRSIPWPVKGGTLKEVTEANVQEFFYHAPKNITDWSGSFLQMLRLQLKRWHPDRVARALPLAQRSDDVVAKMDLVVAFIEEMVKDEEE